MKILITGVAGFIGSNLAIRLLAENHEVTGIDNLSYGHRRNIEGLLNNPKFKFIIGDIANPLILNGIKAECIVHLASQKIPRYSNALRTIDENYLMLKNIVQKCLYDKAKIVFASTSDVYGKNTEVPFNEESDMVLGSTKIKRWAYALSKIYGEQYIIANNDEYDLEYTIMRFFGSYGPNQNLSWWGGPQSVFIENAINKEPLEIHGDGLQTRTFTFVEDTVDGIMHCIFHKKAKNDIFNIGSNKQEEITILDLAKMIWSMINKAEEPMIKFIPYNTFGRYEDVMRRVPDISKAVNAFNYSPKWPIERGLLKTIEWRFRLPSDSI